MKDLYVVVNINGEVVNITDDIETANEMMGNNQVTQILVNNPLDEDEVNAAVESVLANLA